MAGRGQQPREAPRHAEVSPLCTPARIPAGRALCGSVSRSRGCWAGSRGCSEGEERGCGVLQ
eukprot:3752250-Rhodomonas_salina.2